MTAIINLCIFNTTRQVT